MTPKWSLFSLGFQYKTVHAFHHLMSTTCTAYLTFLAVMVPVSSVQQCNYEPLPQSFNFLQAPVTSLLGPNALRRSTV